MSGFGASSDEEPPTVEESRGNMWTARAKARKPLMGRLENALTEAEQRGWTVASMMNDWTRVFPN
jgi:hypothetical protein